MGIFTLRRWSFVVGHLTGLVHGHPTIQSGSGITTSRVTHTQGRTVKTASGSVYILDGDPAPHFLELLDYCDLAYREDAPLAALARRRW